MDRRALRCAVEVLGAMIGAGFASGREVAAFFAVHGAWGVVGALAATAVIVWACGRMMQRGEGTVSAGRRWVTVALLLLTGGAMAAASGRVAALLLPVHGAEAIGMVVTLALAARNAQGEGRGRWMISAALLVCLAVTISTGFMTSDDTRLLRREALWTPLHAAASGLCYGGFNAMLAAPVVVCTGGQLSARSQRRAAWMIGGGLLALLLGCMAALVRHPAAMAAELPLLLFASPLGRWADVLCGACLYLAALTTVTAAQQGLQAMTPRLPGWVLTVAMAIVGLLGFGRLVDVAYPAAGGVCLLMLATEARRNASIS